MENAGHRVVEFLAERFAPLAAQRIVVALRQGQQRRRRPGDRAPAATRAFHPAALYVVLLAAPGGAEGRCRRELPHAATPAAAPCCAEIPPDARSATLVIDALLGTGISGPAAGGMLDAIREINSGFPLAKVVAVDIPSGMPSDSGEPAGEFARADATVTFTAPKAGARRCRPTATTSGELVVGPIGSPPSLYDDVWLSLVEPAMFRRAAGAAAHAAATRAPSGTCWWSAARAARPERRPWPAWPRCAPARDWSPWRPPRAPSPQIAGHAPELMTEALLETPKGSIAINANLDAIAEGKTVIAMGPGLGRDPGIEALVQSAVSGFAAAHGAGCRLR